MYVLVYHDFLIPALTDVLSLSDKSPQVFNILHKIRVDLNHAVVRMISILPLTSNSF